MEGVLLDAAGKVTNADPILGSVCVVLAIVIGALFFISRKDARELRKEYEGRLLEEKTDHEETRGKLITSIERFAALGEAMRDQSKSFENTLNTAVEIMRERTR